MKAPNSKTAPHAIPEANNTVNSPRIQHLPRPPPHADQAQITTPQPLGCTLLGQELSEKEPQCSTEPPRSGEKMQPTA